jgi:hypothetical protein
MRGDLFLESLTKSTFFYFKKLIVVQKGPTTFCLCDFTQLKVLSQTPPLCSSSSFIEMLKGNLIIVFFFGIKLSYVCIFNFLHLLFLVHFLIVFKSLNFLYLNPRPQIDLSLSLVPVFLPSPSPHISILTLIESNQVSISHPPYFFFSSSIISMVFLLPQSPTWWVSHILALEDQITITGGIFCN